CQHAYGTPFSF
nr:immunoglobulin light chain junction region [Macaca mulatta]MOV34907.1 immunoglobulin light chain junction region [Macaca mulatta]